MGTTTSALVVKNNQAWFAHVGDSRIYFVRGDEIRQITEDHSLVASMVRGLLTPKEAERIRNAMFCSVRWGWPRMSRSISGRSVKENDLHPL
jgi:serine/threonine protein phosphatase PrpC